MYSDDIPIDDEPLGYGWTPISMVEVPPEMVVAIAMGLEEPDVIASRHGFAGEKWAKLQAWKPFLDTVATQRTEFEKSGLSFRIKAAMKADLLADKLFVDAMGNDVTLMQRMEATKLFAKLGNLEPKEEKSAQAGTTFAISIDLGDRSVSLNAQKAPDVIDIEPKYVDPFHLTSE
jgi:hypothetical protein